jgi:hypothetical protein
MTTFYKVVMNGSANGQDIKNILYYRAGVGVDMTGLPMAGASALAGNIKQELWPKMKQLLCNQYTLETIDVSPINNEFELIYQMPHSLAVGETGAQTAPSFGTAACYNFKFQLEPTSILNGVKPPSRGYIALGPIPADKVGEDGYVNTDYLTNSQVLDFAAALGSNIEQLVPAPQTWYPIRLKQSRILGGLIHWESYADVSGAVISRRASFRRSRMPES